MSRILPRFAPRFPGRRAGYTLGGMATRMALVLTATGSLDMDPAAAPVPRRRPTATLFPRLAVPGERLALPSRATKLKRTATGWTPTGAVYGPPSPAPPLNSELEKAALAWDLACAQARRTASCLAAAYGAHPDVLSVAADGDRAVLAVRIIDVRAWYVWRLAMGVSAEDVVFYHDACVGVGLNDGVRLQVVGLGVPMLLDAVAAAARVPYRLWDQVYDLAASHEDALGNRWQYEGIQAPDGVPLISMAGRGEPCRITNVVQQAGPLFALRSADGPVTRTTAAGTTASTPASSPAGTTAKAPASTTASTTGAM